MVAPIPADLLITRDNSRDALDSPPTMGITAEYYHCMNLHIKNLLGLTILPGEQGRYPYNRDIDHDILEFMSFLSDKSDETCNLHITKENAQKYLIMAKSYDILFNTFDSDKQNLLPTRSTYTIRTLCLIMLNIPTTEAYTYSLDPDKLNNEDYLRNPSNWVRERIGFYNQMIIPKAFKRMLKLSQILDQDPSHPRDLLFVLKGNSGVGKTKYLQNNIIPNFPEAAEGAINPDYMKYSIKKKTGILLTGDESRYLLPKNIKFMKAGKKTQKTCISLLKTPSIITGNSPASSSNSTDQEQSTLNETRYFLPNQLVHNEVAKGPLNLYLKKIRNDPQYNIIIDARLSSPEEFEEIIEAAKVRNKRIRVIDLEASPFTVFARILGNRSPQGKDPCVHPNTIMQGIQETRQSRLAIIEKVKEEIFEQYKLYYTDSNGECKLVAEKIGDQIPPTIKELHDICTSPMDDKKEVTSTISSGETSSPATSSSITELNEPSTFDKTGKEAKMKSNVNEGIISEVFVDNIIKKGIVPVEAKENLLRWRGFTLEKALTFHFEGYSTIDAAKQLKHEIKLYQKYGSTKPERMPISNIWLSDYPEVFEHVRTEQLFHIRGTDEKGRGLSWRTNKFKWALNKDYNPEEKGGFQMRLGYFLIPKAQLEFFRAKIPLSEAIRHELVHNEYYRFFVHPEAYEHFLPLLRKKNGIEFIKPEASEFIGTPTSAYRTWVIRRVDDHLNPQKDSIPFMIKFGVGTYTNSSKLLSRDEIERSIKNQDIIDDIIERSIESQDTTDHTKDKDQLLCFTERLGFIPKEISDCYPTPKDPLSIRSGNIIREFPPALLGKYHQKQLEEKQAVFTISTGETSLASTSSTVSNLIEPSASDEIVKEAKKPKIFSLSAVMSPYRDKHPNICRLSDSSEKTIDLTSSSSCSCLSPKPIEGSECPTALDQLQSLSPEDTNSLPLIFSMIEIAINKGEVTSAFEYIQKYFIDMWLNTIENVVFKHGLSLPLHGQNLSIVLGHDNLPKGFAIKDLGDIHRNSKRYIQTYSWFYRYHVFIKLLNVIAATTEEFLPSVSGIPKQKGEDHIAPERSVYQNVYINCSSPIQQKMKELSITLEQYKQLIEKLDDSYESLLKKYFYINCPIRDSEGCFPSAEPDSSSENEVEEYNKYLFFCLRRLDKAARSSLSPSQLDTLDHGEYGEITTTLGLSAMTAGLILAGITTPLISIPGIIAMSFMGFGYKALNSKQDFIRRDINNNKVNRRRKHIKELTVAAKMDDVKAQCYLGLVYLYGRINALDGSDDECSSQRNLQEGVNWLKRAAGELEEFNNLEKLMRAPRESEEFKKLQIRSIAATELADCYYHGIGVEEDREKAQWLYESLSGFNYKAMLRMRGDHSNNIADYLEKVDSSNVLKKEIAKIKNFFFSPTSNSSPFACSSSQAEALKMMEDDMLHSDIRLPNTVVSTNHELFLDEIVSNYLVEMKKLWVWGGDIELNAISQIYKCKILISRNEEVISIGDQNLTQSIHLRYTGDHYSFFHEDTEYPIKPDGNCLFNACIQAHKLNLDPNHSFTQSSREQILDLRAQVCGKLEEEPDRIKERYRCILEAEDRDELKRAREDLLRAPCVYRAVNRLRQLRPWLFH